MLICRSAFLVKTILLLQKINRSNKKQLFMLLLLPRFLRLFFTSNSAVLLVEAQNVSCSRAQDTFATPLITLWVPLLRHNGFVLVSED